MSDGYGFSALECKIIQEQIKRRQCMREEFLKLRSDPYKHAAEAGYVFDNGIQCFMSLKTCQNEYFIASPRTAHFGLLAIVAPMVGFGYLCWSMRESLERDYRCGKIRYRDRILKFK
ncbi:uncharacterized protein LOC134744853 [Cydia strobilella]|uniref:uncharacterized protein LOC134744853 n=1 Tax=Cydia strobilella TaxID=1100964 RepID=UPI003007BDB8